MRPAALEFVYRTGSKYELDLAKAVHFVTQGPYKRIGLQLPEGLKTEGYALSKQIEKWTGAMVIISADPCFGSCDLVERDLEPLGVEAIVHVGHTRMPSVTVKMPTFFVAAVREANGRYRCVVTPVDTTDTGDREADVDSVVARYTAILESWVRQYPGQYFWHHRRWKRQPPDTPDELRDPVLVGAGGAEGRR